MFRLRLWRGSHCWFPAVFFCRIEIIELVGGPSRIKAPGNFVAAELVQLRVVGEMRSASKQAMHVAQTVFQKALARNDFAIAPGIVMHLAPPILEHLACAGDVSVTSKSATEAKV